MAHKRNTIQNLGEIKVAKILDFHVTYSGYTEFVSDCRIHRKPDKNHVSPGHSYNTGLDFHRIPAARLLRPGPTGELLCAAKEYNRINGRYTPPLNTATSQGPQRSEIHSLQSVFQPPPYLTCTLHFL